MASATGDLDITENLTIKGSGSTSTIIDGNSLDRVFEVLGGSTTISGVTIQNGQANNAGGGLLNLGGRVTLSSVVVVHNRADGASGFPGAAALGNSNGGQGGNGMAALGGGIDNAAGSLKIVNSTVMGNLANGGAGGAGGQGGLLGASPADAMVRTPSAPMGGWAVMGQPPEVAIYNAPSASLTISSTLIASNIVRAGSGGQGGGGGNAGGGDSGTASGSQARIGGKATAGVGRRGSRRCGRWRWIVQCWHGAAPGIHKHIQIKHRQRRRGRRWRRGGQRSRRPGRQRTHDDSRQR